MTDDLDELLAVRERAGSDASALIAYGYSALRLKSNG